MAAKYCLYHSAVLQTALQSRTGYRVSAINPDGNQVHGGTHDVRRKIDHNQDPGCPERRLEILPVGEAQLYQADGDSCQQDRSRVARQADDEVEGVSSWRCANEENSYPKM